MQKMNRLKIIITDRAQSDIRKIKNYISKDNKSASKSFAIKLKNSFINLSAYPRLGKSRPEFSGNTNILFLPVMKNYLVVYYISQEKIYIVRVLSNYQNICSILNL